MSQALVSSDPPRSPTGRALVLAEALTQEAEQRQLLMQYVAHHMVEGTDYGVIPGTERKDKDGKPAPTPKALLKPGAEKLTELFRCTPKFRQTKCIEDWDKPLFFYEFECLIEQRDTGAVLAHGVGSCNSRESKYRWRNADRACPACGAAAIKRSKFPPKDDPDGTPGWYCFAKAGGCGANYGHDDAAITGQAVGRVENPDVADAVNSILKIAKKRALVDAAIALARCSDLFTQDVEDFAGDEPARPRPDASAEPRAAVDTALFDRLAGAIRGAGTEDACKAAFAEVNANKGRLTPRQLAELTALKDAVKARLTPPPADPAPPRDREPGDDDPDDPDDPPAVGGEQRPGPTPATPATTAAATATTGATVTPSSSASPSTAPGTEPRPRISGDRVSQLLTKFHALDLSWPQVQAEFKDLLRLDSQRTRVGDLAPDQADRLEAVLDDRLAAKKRRADARKERVA